MTLGFRLHHPGGMLENSPAFQRRESGDRAPSPGGTAEIAWVSRPSGTYPTGTSNPALKRRAIIVCPSGTETASVSSNPSGIDHLGRTRRLLAEGIQLPYWFPFGLPGSGSV